MTAHVSVEAAARLHLGFLDMNGSLNRMYGGLGLSVTGLRTRLTLRRRPKHLSKGSRTNVRRNS